jgi:hypothetical protein
MSSGKLVVKDESVQQAIILALPPCLIYEFKASYLAEAI